MKKKNDRRWVIGCVIFLGLLIFPPTLCVLTWYGALSVSAEWDSFARVGVVIAMIGLTLIGIGTWAANILGLMGE